MRKNATIIRFPVPTLPILVTSAWHILTSTLPGQLFLFSAIVLLVGAAVKIWDQAIQWSFLNSMLLSEVERSHPHLPSCKIIAIIFLCNIQLLVLSMYASSGVAFFRTANYYWLYLAAVFILSALAWILAELRGQRAAEYGLAFNAGTTVAFFFLLLQMSLAGGSVVQVSLLLSLFFFCILLMWFVLARILMRAPRLVLVSTIAFWLLLSQLR